MLGEVLAQKWSLTETYDAKNFFKKFNFIVSKYDNITNDIDLSHGFVQYVDQTTADPSGLSFTMNASGG